MDIKIEKPRIFNVDVKATAEIGDNASNEFRHVAYAARVSGVPPSIPDEESFLRMWDNGYMAPMRLITFRWMLLMTKGNDPEQLRNKIGKEQVGRSTRYLDAGDDGKYRIILPWHILQVLTSQGMTVESFEELINNDSRLEKAGKPIDMGGDSMVSELTALYRFAESVKWGIHAYEELLESGIPRESARYVLPFCMAEAHYIQDVSLDYMDNFIKQRLCVRASPEMRCLASQMYFHLIEALPILWGRVGCSGFRNGLCPESGVTGHRVKDGGGKRSCPFADKESLHYIPTVEEFKEGHVNEHRAEDPEAVTERQLDIIEKMAERMARWGQ